MDNFTNHTLLSYSNVEDMMSTAGSHDYFSCMDIWIVRKDRKKKNMTLLYNRAQFYHRSTLPGNFSMVCIKHF